jgi:hypothetical protein
VAAIAERLISSNISPATIAATTTTNAHCQNAYTPPHGKAPAVASSISGTFSAVASSAALELFLNCKAEEALRRLRGLMGKLKLTAATAGAGGSSRTRRAEAAGRKPAVSGETSDKPRIETAVLHLTPGKLNAVRAAFKAGVKPSQIARQFGLSQVDVRKALACEASRRGPGVSPG